MKKVKLLSALLLTGALLAACGDDEGTKKEALMDTKIVTVATGGSSGPYNLIGTQLASVYTKDLNVNSRTEATGSSVENLNLLDMKKAEVAFVMSDAFQQALNGEVVFDKKIESVSQIATLYPNVVQIVTKKGSGIKDLDDLKGKRVAVGARNSGVEVNARQILEAYGITYKDIKVDYLGYAEASEGFSNGTIHAAFLTSGLPNSSVIELMQTGDYELVNISTEDVGKIKEKHDYFIPYTIKSGVYGKTEVNTIAVKNALVVRKDLSEKDVYNLTKKFFEELDLLKNSHQSMNDVTVESAQEGLVGELHPGAKKYYDEVNKK